MKKRVFIVGNPGSGKKRLDVILNEFKAYLKDQKIAYDFYESQLNAPHPITTYLNSDFSDLVIIGGDGTINEAINALEYNIPVGIIPAGTGNDFVKNIHIGSTRLKHFETAISGRVEQIDLGVCNGRKFANGVGIGFDGQIVEDMATRRVPLLKGFSAYYYHVLRILAGYKDRSFAYEIDGRSTNKSLILLTVANGTTFGGGFKLTPAARIDDGLLDICEIGPLSSFRRFINIHRLSNGSHGKIDAVELKRASTVSIEANENLYAHIDGERLAQPPFEIKVLPKALKLRVASNI